MRKLGGKLAMPGRLAIAVGLATVLRRDAIDVQRQGRGVLQRRRGLLRAAAWGRRRRRPHAHGQRANRAAGTLAAPTGSSAALPTT
jgi:hypothetical protein